MSRACYQRHTFSLGTGNKADIREYVKKAPPTPIVVAHPAFLPVVRVRHAILHARFS